MGRLFGTIPKVRRKWQLARGTVRHALGSAAATAALRVHIIGRAVAYVSAPPLPEPSLLPLASPLPPMRYCQVLNVGLLVGALFHILELGSLLVDGGIQARPGTAVQMLPSGTGMRGCA